MRTQELKVKRRIKRKAHIRKNMTGTATNPRLSVYRSNINIYAQIIDDTLKKTIVSASTLDSEIKSKITAETNKSKQSELVGELLAKRAKSAKIQSIKFDRNGYSFHGRVKALAEGARKGGLKF